ncbi:MAG: 4'-phosphopantetheinyl transferase superfamily protein [Acidobacteriaceae bacterium]
MSTQILYWPQTQPVPPLNAKQVHVWVWNLEAPPLPSHWEILSEEEALRARRFVFPRDRDRYVRAHATMRTLLGGYSGVSPATLSFSANAYGKPEIKSGNTPRPVRFNLTHSDATAALAVSDSYDLGIDIEHVRPIEAAIAEDHFSTRELRTLRSLPSEQWLQGFYRCWTSKEALLKGEGMGLNLPLDGFDVEVHPKRPPALLAVRPQAKIASTWRLAELTPAQDILGTLAILDAAETFEDTSLRCFALSDSMHS